MDIKNKGFLYIEIFVQTILIVLLSNFKTIFIEHSLLKIINPITFFAIVMVVLCNLFLKRKNYKKLNRFIFISLTSILFINNLLSSLNIINYALVFYFLIYIAFVIHLLKGTNFEFSLCLGTMLLIIIYFLIVILNIISLNKVIFIFLVLLNIIIVIKQRKKQKILEKIENFITSNSYIYLLFFIIASINGFERYVNVWDEYNMWALSSKSLILGKEILDSSYPPILAVWHSVFNIFTNFNEPGLYIGHMFLIYTFLMPLFSNIKNKIYSLVMIIICISFFNLFGDVYNSTNLYADLPSAIFFGFSLIVLFSNLKDNMKMIIIILSVIIITLSKPQGFCLGTTTLGIYFLYSIFDKKWDKKKKIILYNIKDLIKKCWIVVIPVTIYFLWLLIYSKLLSSNIYISEVTGPAGLSDTLISNFSFDSIVLFIYKVILFLDEKVLFGIIDISFVGYYIISCLILYFCFKYTKKEKIIVTSFALAIIFYYGITAISLAVKMPIADALNLSSFRRYLGNFNVGMLLFIIWALSQCEQKRLRIIVYTFIIVSIPVSTTFNFIFDYQNRKEKKETMYNIIETFKPVIDNTKETDKIYIINQLDTGGYLPMIHASYYLYPRITSMNTQINWRIQTDLDRTEWVMDAKELEETLLKNKFDYVYLYTANEEFFKEISFMLDKTVENNIYTLFKIKNENNTIRLIPVD